MLCNGGQVNFKTLCFCKNLNIWQTIFVFTDVDDTKKKIYRKIQGDIVSRLNCSIKFRFFLKRLNSYLLCSTV